MSKTSDENLLAEFVNSFAKLDDMFLANAEDAAPELRLGWIDGYERWQPIRVQTDRAALNALYQRLAR